MKLDHTGRFAMLPRTLLELPGNRPLDVSCDEGTLWLTMDNDPRNFVLERGERVRLELNAQRCSWNNPPLPRTEYPDVFPHLHKQHRACAVMARRHDAAHPL